MPESQRHLSTTVTLGGAIKGHLTESLNDSEIESDLFYHDLFQHMPWVYAIWQTEGLSEKCRNAAHILMQGPLSEPFVMMFGGALKYMGEKQQYEQDAQKVEYLKTLFENNYLFQLRSVFTAESGVSGTPHQNYTKKRYTGLGLDIDESIVDEMYSKSAEIAEAALEYVVYWDKLIGERTEEFFQKLRDEGVENVPGKALSPLELFPNPYWSLLKARPDPVYYFMPSDTEAQRIVAVLMNKYAQEWLEFIYDTPVAEKYILK